MEQRATGLTEIELEVVDFMEELRVARLRPSPRGSALFAWGSKRRRSAIDRSPSPLSPPTPKKPKVSSPATTLAFPPSESEEKVSTSSISKPLKLVTLSKLPKKMEDLQKQCDSLSTEREELLQVKEGMLILKRKLEEEQSFLREKLLVEKVKQQQQQLCSESEPPATTLTLDFTLAQPTVSAHHHHHHRPLIVDQTAGERRIAYQPPVLSPCTTSNTTTSTREELFDLNVAPAEEAPAPVAAPQPPLFLNLRSLEMAETARRNRMARKEKIQSKNGARLRAVR